MKTLPMIATIAAAAYFLAGCASASKDDPKPSAEQFRSSAVRYGESMVFDNDLDGHADLIKPINTTIYTWVSSKYSLKGYVTKGYSNIMTPAIQRAADQYIGATDSLDFAIATAYYAIRHPELAAKDSVPSAVSNQPE